MRTNYDNFTEEMRKLNGQNLQVSFFVDSVDEFVCAVHPEYRVCIRKSLLDTTLCTGCRHNN